MDSGIKYLVNSEDFLATRIALNNAKLLAMELTQHYSTYHQTINVKPLVEYQNEIDALLKKLDYHKLGR